MRPFKIGVLADSFRLPVEEGIRKAAELGAEGVQVYAVGGEVTPEAMDAGGHIRYHRDPAVAVANVNAGRGDLVLLLNPTRIEQVKACAEQGIKMPQKSTDFYPKMVTGLTMMAVSAGERIP